MHTVSRGRGPNSSRPGYLQTTCVFWGFVFELSAGRMTLRLRLFDLIGVTAHEGY